ncbi:MAG TPA: HlyD family type I secretion periplasmic adaptor subunit [Devosiaceae bacterium]|nr:HlyD family type I secretion periplasmic adaptor subunit [Devosiaceae bacterium]
MTMRIAGLRGLPPSEILSPSMLSLRRHGFVGVGIIAALVFGLGGTAATTQIAGAVIANGLVVVDGGSKRVQHQEGGIVKQILVRDDDKVAAGQPLVRLDDVAIRANLDVVLSQLRDAIGADSRLTAESTDAPRMLMPSIVGNWPADPDLAASMGDQERLRQTRKQSLEAQAAQLDQQISQKQSEIQGLKSQQDATNRQLDLTRAENANLAKLFSQGLVEIQRVNDMKRTQAQLEGQAGGFVASIASAEANISQLQMQRNQLYTDFHAQVLNDLQAASQKVAELMQNKISAEDKLTRLDIKAPIAGTVHESVVHTVGGVVAPGDTLMMIVPQENHLLIDTRVSPLDIDKLHLEQDVNVQLSGFDTRTTPQLTGKVKMISPDLTRDPNTGVEYYSVRVDVPDSERGKLPQEARLVPGMPAEVFIRTGDRTLWSYLTGPLTEELSHTFRQ